MRGDAERLRALYGQASALLSAERLARGDAFEELLGFVSLWGAESADHRLARLRTDLAALAAREAELFGLLERGALEPLGEFAARLTEAEAAAQLGGVAAALAEARGADLAEVSRAFLHALLRGTGAVRGLVVFRGSGPDEVDVVAASGFEARDLTVSEHGFSRTILRDVLERKAAVALEDASRHPDYAARTSVRSFGLRSVVAAPLRRDTVAVGVVYLEGGGGTATFGASDAALLERSAALFVAWCERGRLLPAAPKAPTRLDDEAAELPSEAPAFVGESEPIRRLLATVDAIADAPATVLIEGETGTGKELVARALHARSARRGRPFVAMNCSAIPESLFESELFGHERGAFTGAVERFIGRLERADRGTVFLDEIGEMPLAQQGKLLRFLQSREIDRVGSRETIKVDVRVLAATSKPLDALVREGRFQEALYYRVAVVPLRVPSLRQRGDDVLLLFDHFLSRFSRLYGKELAAEPELRAALAAYPFPGNVRQLENLVHRLVALSEGELLRLFDLPAEYRDASRRISLAPRGPSVGEIRSWEELARRRAELEALLDREAARLAARAVEEAGGNVTAAASRLGLHRATLHRLLRDHAEPPSRL